MLPHDEIATLTRPVPRFEPHPLFKGGHAQTIAGRFLPGSGARLGATYHEIGLEDGDRLSVLDSTPTSWRKGDPAVVLVHGLAGCARSPYVARIGARLAGKGYRVVRMNLRGAGSGFGAARGIYHGGRTDDLREVVEWVAGRSVGSPIGLIGFSLGGNLVLKLAAEAAERPVTGLDCVLAANPPLDLAACCRHIQRPENRVYDRHFVRMLRREVGRLHRAFPDLGRASLEGARSVHDFDEAYTAPRKRVRLRGRVLRAIERGAVARTHRLAGPDHPRQGRPVHPPWRVRTGAAWPENRNGVSRSWRASRLRQPPSVGTRPTLARRPADGLADGALEGLDPGWGPRVILNRGRRR